EELHDTLAERTRRMFQRLDASVPEDNVIFLIKDYIAKHYGSDLLSIKEISDYVHLSASYVCTYFKTQTGQTLNQYLTEYRMEKAMHLLEDARNQIADISAKVGYSNGNYFSKSFKKFTGLTPSKYREKMLG
ncbi:MAG: AraC family transcriptional regulator, partial [Schaedlerella arabinosiphila]|nr:AraC family transcriptional regulator [Schaedlerella arabinosiphila]